jgi:dTDP-4-dehydrorhamnose reductase
MATPKQPTILLTGADGQLGYELTRTAQGLGRVVALNRRALDICDLDKVRQTLHEVKPSLIINAAAYTSVDQAESDPTAARRANFEAPAVMAEEAGRINAAVIHYSTDYVFDGRKNGAYVEHDLPNPQNVYGASKLEGEQAISASGCAHLIFRTSWVYGTRGKNFLLTMLRLGAERETLNVVADQYGAPVWSRMLAELTSQVLAQSFSDGDADSDDWWRTNTGIYHLTSAGKTSWHGFAESIFELSGQEHRPVVNPIAAASYGAPAIRPANSILANDKFIGAFHLRAPNWRESLELCMQEYRRP